MLVYEYEKAIERAIARLDLKKILKVMKFLKWTWRGEVPQATHDLASTLAHLQYTILSEMRRNPEQKAFYVATGGFSITVFTEFRSVNVAFYVDNATETCRRD